MGSSINTAVNTTIQTSTNDIFQQSSSICQANCTQDISDVNIIVVGGSTVDTINFDQKCDSNALCTMKNQLDTIATQQLAAVQQAQASAPGQAAFFTWPGYSINTTNNFTNQTLSNTITQVIDSVCVANASSLTRNVNVYIGEGSEVGAVSFSQENSVQASCAIENTAAVAVSQSASSEQTARSKAGSALVLIIMIITVGVILIGLAWISAVNNKNQRTTEKETIVALAGSGAIAPGSLTAADIVQIARGKPIPPPGEAQSE